jgi:hypothetical protein
MDHDTLIEELLLERRERIVTLFEEQVAAIDATIAEVRTRRSQTGPETATGATINPTEGMEGMELTNALRLYLGRREGHATCRQAAIDLAAAGLDLGTPDRHEQNLKIRISNNRDAFCYVLYGKVIKDLRNELTGKTKKKQMADLEVWIRDLWETRPKS